jgi:phytoene dehydrogenase-like protein
MLAINRCGLACAAALARTGYVVCVLVVEQHYAPGGDLFESTKAIVDRL